MLIFFKTNVICWVQCCFLPHLKQLKKAVRLIGWQLIPSTDGISRGYCYWQWSTGYTLNGPQSSPELSELLLVNHILSVLELVFLLSSALFGSKPWNEMNNTAPKWQFVYVWLICRRKHDNLAKCLCYLNGVWRGWLPYWHLPTGIIWSGHDQLASFDEEVEVAISRSYW